MRNKSVFIILILALLALFASIYPNKSTAIPYWSRIYKTECHTCHFHFPKLTPLGEAFRKQGFRFPDGPYEERVSNQSRHRNVFESLPLSVDLTSISELERGEGISFNDFGGDFLIMSGGALNRKVSFYGSIDFFVDGGSDDIDVIIPRMSIMYRPFGNSLLNIKVGRFEPRVMGVSNFRTITPAFGILNRTVGDNEWNLEPSQQGIELSGILGKGRLAYSAGVVEGRGNQQNDFKDFYGRLEYKFGGMRLDGIQDGEQFTGLISNSWKDNSLTVGIFGYHGEADVERIENEFVGIEGAGRFSRTVRAAHTPGLGGDDDGGVRFASSKRDRFYKTGADINWFTGKWNILGGYALQHHSSPISNDADQSITEHQAFVEIDYAMSHWFTPTIRYEVFLQENRGNMLQRIQPQLNFMPFGPAVHIFISEDFVKDVGDSGFSATTGIAGIDIVF